MKDIYIASYSQDNALFQKVITCFNGQDKNLEKFVVVGEKIKNKETKNRMELEFDRLYEKILNIKYTKEIAYTYLKELKRYHSITARLLEAYLYFISGNAARTERIILDIVKKNLLEHSLNSDFRLFSYEDQKKKIFNLLEILKNEQLHNKILDNLLYYFYYGTSGPFQKELSKKFPRNENITHLRKLYNSAIYGKRFPYVWSLAILQNGSLNEYSKYIAESTTIALLENGKLDALSFFLPLNSIDRPYQNLVIKNFNLLKENADIYSREVLYNLIQHERFLKFISIHSPFKLGLLANTKRNSYSEVLKNPEIYEYALFKLILIGDIRMYEIQNLIKMQGY